MKVRMRIASGLCLALMVCIMSGCPGKTKPPETGSASGGPGQKSGSDNVPLGGVVTLNGKPAQGIRVYLTTKENAAKSTDAHAPFVAVGLGASTDAEGKWKYGTTTQADGVAPGEYVVYFHWLPRKLMQEIIVDEDQTIPESLQKEFKMKPGQAAFYEKYRGGGPGNMKITVEKGKPQTELKWDLATE